MSNDKALVKIKPQVRAEEQEALDNLAALKGAKCGPEDAAEWADAAVEVRRRWQALDEKEKTITRPLLQSLEAARTVFRPGKHYWRDCEAVIKEKLGALKVAQLEAENEALDEAADAADTGNDNGVTTALAKRPGKVLTPGVSLPLDWDFEVVAVDLLPTEFVMPDLRAIRDEVRRQAKDAPDEEPSIPGVRFTRVARARIHGKVRAHAG